MHLRAAHPVVQARRPPLMESLPPQRPQLRLLPAPAPATASFCLPVCPFPEHHMAGTSSLQPFTAWSLTGWRACLFLGVFPLLSVVLFVNALSCPCFQMLGATSPCSSSSRRPLCRADRDRVPRPQDPPAPRPKGPPADHTRHPPCTVFGRWALCAKAKPCGWSCVAAQGPLPQADHRTLPTPPGTLRAQRSVEGPPPLPPQP